eukprot:3783473-Amphidinium_carterae.1
MLLRMIIKIGMRNEGAAFPVMGISTIAPDEREKRSTSRERENTNVQQARLTQPFNFSLTPVLSDG